MRHACLLLGLLLLAVSAADGAPDPAADCAPSAGLRFICGPQASEDLVRIPHSNWLIASGMNVGQPAHLYLIDTVHKTSAILFPTAGAGAPAAGPATACRGPPDPARMSMDGLALRAGRNGIHTLYAANHGDRMAIEFFAIDVRDAQPTLRWLTFGGLCVTFSQSTVDSTIAIWALDRYQAGPRTVGLALLGLAIVAVAMQTFGVRRLVPRVGEFRLAPGPGQDAAVTGRHVPGVAVQGHQLHPRLPHGPLEPLP